MSGPIELALIKGPGKSISNSLLISKDSSVNFENAFDFKLTAYISSDSKSIP